MTDSAKSISALVNLQIKQHCIERGLEFKVTNVISALEWYKVTLIISTNKWHIVVEYLLKDVELLYCRGSVWDDLTEWLENDSEAAYNNIYAHNSTQDIYEAFVDCINVVNHYLRD